VGYKAVDFSYTSDHQLASAAGYGGPSSSKLALSENYGYDHVGDLTSLTDWGYYGSSSGTVSVELESLSMGYDSDGEATSVNNSVHSSENTSLSYDHDGQLIGASGYGGSAGSGGSLDLGYDSNGNLAGSGTSVGAGNTQLAANGNTYTFDAAGNMLTRTDSSGNALCFTWDDRDRLTSVTLENSSGVPQWSVSYAYDMFNEIIARTNTSYYSDGTEEGTFTRRYISDPTTGQTLLAINQFGILTDRFLWGPQAGQILLDETIGFPSTVERWMATNNTGSVADVWEGYYGGYGGGYGAVLDHLDYNAFGGIVSQTHSAYAPLFGYNGEYTDPLTGLQYHNDPTSGEPGRWYDPLAQRWLSEDPIFPLSGPDPYEYCGNAPTNYEDPTGQAAAPGAGLPYGKLYPPGKWRPATGKEAVEGFATGLGIGAVVVGGIEIFGPLAAIGAGGGGTTCGAVTVTTIASRGPILSAYFTAGAKLANTPENIAALQWYEQKALDIIEQYQTMGGMDANIAEQQRRLQMLQQQLQQWGAR